MKKLYGIILFLLLLISVSSLFHSGLPITHDGQDHVARIANFYHSLTEGVVIPRWAENLNWGYGHPILQFLYPLPSYFASFFHFIGFSFVDSTKIVFGLGMVLSGIFMFMWLSEFLDEGSSFIGSLIYVFTPYRFVDLNVRGAIGENFIFIWLPLFLYFIYKLYKTNNYKFALFGSIPLAFMVLSHNALSLMFLPFIIFYFLFLLYFSKPKQRKPLFINLILTFLLGFCLSAFFWIPALIEGKYTLRNIVTANDYLSRFVNPKDLLYGPWSYGITGQFTVQLGIVNIIFTLLSFPVLFFLRKRKDKNFIFVVALIVYLFTSIFLMTKESVVIWNNLSILRNFQFPWRFLTVSVFATAVLSALVLSQIKKKPRTVLVFVFAIAILLLNKDYLKARDYQQKDESFYTGIYKSTTDTGESSPLWGTRFMGSVPKERIQVIDGKARIKEKERTSTNHAYEITALTKVRILENTVYFPGWVVFDNNEPTSIEFQDPRYRGIMTFYLEKGTHEVNVSFFDTKVRQVANLISFISLVLLISLFGIKLRGIVK